jgi:hypothetical protein
MAELGERLEGRFEDVLWVVFYLGLYGALVLPKSYDLFTKVRKVSGMQK